METGYAVGSKILGGNWTLTKLLGEGSYGKVYEAVHANAVSVERAAIKIIPFPKSDDDIKTNLAKGLTREQCKQQYEEEAAGVEEILGRLKGKPNVVRYEEWSRIPHEDGVGFDLVVRMELLTSLLDYIQKHGFDQREAARLGCHICEALEICKSERIIHRDVKPANILVTDSGDYKLGDFGIALMSQSSISSGYHTQAGAFRYMAPEVQLCQKYNSTADIYSLGRVLYEFLSKPSNTRPNDEARSWKKPLPIQADIDPDLGKIIQTACAYPASKRYASAALMKEDLQCYLAGVPVFWWKSDWWKITHPSTLIRQLRSYAQYRKNPNDFTTDPGMIGNEDTGFENADVPSGRTIRLKHNEPPSSAQNDSTLILSDVSFPRLSFPLRHWKAVAGCFFLLALICSLCFVFLPSNTGGKGNSPPPELTWIPTMAPTKMPTTASTEIPTTLTATPTITPTVAHTATLTMAPTTTPTATPTIAPTTTPTATPTTAPTATPAATPTTAPTTTPTATPTTAPTTTPTRAPTATPTNTPIPTPIDILVEQVSLNKGSLEINRGSTEVLIATVVPQNAANNIVIWSSSSPGIASVSNGAVTGVTAGEAVITASCGGKAAECFVRVKIPVESVTLNTNALNLNKGQSTSLTATVTPEDAPEKTVTWSSSNPEVATVDNNGTVTAVSGGNATITASCGEKSVDCRLTVRVPAERITISPEEYTFYYSQTAKQTTHIVNVEVDVFPEDTTDILNISSSNSSVYNYDFSFEPDSFFHKDGKASMILVFPWHSFINSVGETTIIATCGEKKASANYTLLLAPEDAYFTESNINLSVGETHQLQVEVYPKEAHYLVKAQEQGWSSSNPSIAFVDQNGLVTATGGGTAEISLHLWGEFMNRNFAYATCTVVVG